MNYLRLWKLGSTLVAAGVGLVLSASGTKKRIIDLQNQRETEKRNWENNQNEKLLAGIQSFHDTAGALLLDVREKEDYDAGHIPGSTFAPLRDIVSAVEAINPDRSTPIFVYCYRGRRSGYAASMLKDAGYTDVTSIGGMDWYTGEIIKS